MTRRKIVITSIIAAAIIIVVVAVTSAGSKVQYETAKVDVGSVAEEVSVTGSIAPISKIELKPEAVGKVVKIAVKEGDLVKSGDLLLQVDTSDLQSRITSQRAAVDAAKAQLDALIAGATAEDIRLSQAAVDAAKAQYDAAVSAKADAEVALGNARSNYDAVDSKADVLLASKIDAVMRDFDEALTVSEDAVNRLTYPLFTSSDYLAFTSSDAQAESDAVSTRREAKDAIALMRSAVSSVKVSPTMDSMDAAYPVISAGLTATKRHVDVCSLALNYASTLSSTTLSSYQANVSAAQTALNAMVAKLASDKNGLDLQEKYNNTDLAASQTAVDNAQAALNAATRAISTADAAYRQAQAAYELKKAGTRPESIAAQRAAVASAQGALSGLYTELNKRSILAPVDAVVTEVTVELGETAQPAQTAVILNTEGRFEIISNISEVDIARIRIGNPVKITLDAFSSDEEWTGKVIDVRPAEKVVEGVIFYETKVVFDQDDPRLKSGMTANLDIEVARSDDALRIPLRALKESLGRQYVEVLEKGKAVERDIKAGIENNEHVEVIDGLKEGDEVVIAANGK